MVDLKYYRKWAKEHYNFMTPQIISVRDRDPYVIEISEGTDFNHNQIFGVTLLKMCGSTFNSQHEEGLNKCCRSWNEVKEQIKLIENRLKELRADKH